MEKVSSLLGFSINEKDANKEFIYPALDHFFEVCKNQDKILLVADSLREKTYRLVDKYSKQKAQRVCMTIGDKFIKIFEEYFKEKSISGVPIIRWAELLAEESYQKLQSLISSRIEEDRHSKELLEAVALQFLKKRNPSKVWNPEYVEAGVDYLLQELPLLFLQFSVKGEQVGQMFYPTTKLQDTKAIFDQLILVVKAVASEHPRSLHQCIEIKVPCCSGQKQTQPNQEL